MSNRNNIIDTLPDVLMDYLRTIVKADSNIQFVRLIPMKLGYGIVQEIILEAQGNAEFRRVFGFTPVDTRLQVIRNENVMPLLVAA
jgi:hypothetical protein